MKIVHHEEPGELNTKRFYFPATLTMDCPACGVSVERDFRNNYIMYPTLGKTFELNVDHYHEVKVDGEWTVACEADWNVQVRLDIVLTAIEDVAGGEEKPDA